MEKIIARLSLLSGCVVLVVAAAFAHLNHGLGAATLPTLAEPLQLLGDSQPTLALAQSLVHLVAFILFALLFQYATPFLCAVAILFGIRARGSWCGRFGFAAGLLGVLPYLAFLRTLYAIAAG